MIFSCVYNITETTKCWKYVYISSGCLLQYPYVNFSQCFTMSQIYSTHDCKPLHHELCYFWTSKFLIQLNERLCDTVALNFDFSLEMLNKSSLIYSPSYQKIL